MPGTDPPPADAPQETLDPEDREELPRLGHPGRPGSPEGSLGRDTVLGLSDHNPRGDR